LFRDELALISRRSILIAGGAAAGGLLLPRIAVAAPADTKITVAAGQTVTLTKTTKASEVSIATGGFVTVPLGHSLTMTVDGVETGSALAKTGGTDTAIAAGSYRGGIVLTVAKENPVSFQSLTFPFRQAIDVNASGVAAAASVLAAVVGGKVTASGASDVRITSTGEAFNGVYVSGGTYALQRPRVAFTGNGRSDFVGYGAAVVGTGVGTRLTVDDATIATKGVVRTAVIADGGSNVVVKNSRISVRNGALPAAYQSTVDTAYMQDAAAGAVRAPGGRTLSLTVDGVAATPAPGRTYLGAIVLTVK
jgi:hypothetical protein